MDWQARKARFPEEFSLLPSSTQAYGEPSSLLTAVKQAFAEHGNLSLRVSSLLMSWALSTWFQEALPLSPCLVITGAPHDGEVVLRLLNIFCYRPVLMTGVTLANLKTIGNWRWQFNPTLLFFDPSWNRQKASLVGSFTAPGYAVPFQDGLISFFGPKAVYVGEDLAPEVLPPYAIHVKAAGDGKLGRSNPVFITNAKAVEFQNQLLLYRLNMLPKVENSGFYPSELSSEANAIGACLGRCIVNAPEIQKEIVSLLMPQAQRQIAERQDSLEALVVVAALSFCHQEKEQVFASEIAAEVNRTLEEQGEIVRYSAEKVGHKLRRIGLPTRRLSQEGNGLVLDIPTRMLIHELAGGYDMEAALEIGKNLHCPQCEETAVVV